MKRLLILLFSILLLVYGISNTFACSCMTLKNPIEEADNYSTIFLGKVKKIETISKSTEYGDIEENKISFDVIYSIKGQDKTIIYVITPKESANCGFTFEKEKDYIVYASKNVDGELNVSLCSRTNLLENANDDITAFNINLESLIKESINNSINEKYDGNIDKLDGKKDLYLTIAFLILGIVLITIGIKIIRNK